MAGQKDLLTSLVALLRSLDDDAYASLANKGLLRRARKDIESGLVIEMGDITERGVGMKVGDCAVLIPASGPSLATCSCPAPGCCQHILAACLKLPEIQPGSENSPTPSTTDATAPVATETPQEQELPGADGVKKWAGADSYRRAHRLLQSGDVQSTEDRLVRFAGEIDVRLLPGGLDAAITNAPPRQRASYVAAAVLALLQKAGVSIAAEQRASDILDLGPLEDLQQIIEEGIEVGLNHLSRAFQMRLSRLSIHCRIEGLIRPSLETESCAQEIKWVLDRHALADQVRLFDKLTRLYALCESIRQQGLAASLAYVGTARSKYSEADTLDLVGVGCYPWETESGFLGLTALFWSASANQYFSWSESRPKHSSAGFVPENRYGEAGPWPNSGTLQDLVRSTFTLQNPKSNAQRRLSSHAGTRLLDSQTPLSEHLPPPLTRWVDLRHRERARGLLRGSPLDDVVHVRPKKWGAPIFDEVDQRLLVPLVDEDDETLFIQLPFSRITASAVFYLEAWKANPALDSLIAYHRREPSEHLFPIRVIREQSATHLKASDVLFQPLPTKKITFRGVLMEKLREFVPLPQADQEASAEPGIANPLTPLLSPIDDILVASAEANLSARSERAREAAGTLRKTGLASFADLIGSLSTPRDLLKARYVYLLLAEES